MAIIDATPVKHTRPLGGNLYANNPELNPQIDDDRIMEKYALRHNRFMAKYHPLSGVRYFSPSLMDQIRLKLRLLNGQRKAKRHIDVTST